MTEPTKPSQNPEDDKSKSDTPAYLLHQRIMKTIDAFMKEYDNLSMPEVVGVLDTAKFCYVREWMCGCDDMDDDDDECDCGECSCGGDEDEPKS